MVALRDFFGMTRNPALWQQSRDAAMLASSKVVGAVKQLLLHTKNVGVLAEQLEQQGHIFSGGCGDARGLQIRPGRSSPTQSLISGLSSTSANR